MTMGVSLLLPYLRRCAARTRSQGPSMSVRIESARVGWGELRTDGTLGYDGGCCTIPKCREDLRDCTLISAHAPSRVEVETDEPVEIFGFLNASAQYHPNNPVEFWANWNFVGEVAMPGQATKPLQLARGRHLLVASAASNPWRHSLWAVRPASAVKARADLSVLTIAAYPEEDVPERLRLLARSARNFGVELIVCFVGQPYVSHSESKIVRLLPILEQLNTPRVAYVDARDCLFVAGADRILEQYRTVGSPIVVSTEAQSWPLADPAWVQRFPKHPSGCNWLNAGQWMGERDALVTALRRLCELLDRARRPKLKSDLADIDLCRRAVHDDQLFWQVAWLNGLVELAPDYDGRIFRNVNTLDTSLVDNRDFDFDEHAVYRASGQQPCVLHFSGSAADYCMHQWGAQLNAF